MIDTDDSIGQYSSITFSKQVVSQVSFLNHNESTIDRRKSELETHFYHSRKSVSGEKPLFESFLDFLIHSFY